MKIRELWDGKKMKVNHGHFGSSMNCPFCGWIALDRNKPAGFARTSRLLKAMNEHLNIHDEPLDAERPGSVMHRILNRGLKCQISARQ